MIQATIDLAGSGGTLAFQGQTFLLNTAVSPKERQSWYCQNTIFQPTGDTACLDIVAVDGFKLLGSLRIQDPAGVTATQPAIHALSMRYAHIQHVSILNYYKGIDLEGNVSGTGTNENVFLDLYMQVRHRGLNLEGSCHDNKFVQIWIKGPAPDSWATGPGIRIATSGTQGGNSIDRAQILDMQTGLDLPGAYEFWFGTIIADNAYGNAVYIAGSCERLFFDTIWAASSGNGIFIEGNETDYPITAADKVYIGKAYCWLNADYGMRLEGYVQQLVVNTLVCQRNDNVGLAFNRWRNESIRIDNLITLENGVVGVDGTGAGPGCIIKNALIYDGIVSPENFEQIEGASPWNGAFQNRGTALLLAGQTSVTVEHGLMSWPAQVWLGHEHPETVGAYVSNKTSTTFTITVPAPVTWLRPVHWYAEAVRKSVGDELVKNADVEAGTSTPDDWFASASGTVWDTAVKRTGYRSLKIQVNNGTANWRSALFSVTANRHYRVQGNFKGNGGPECYLTIRWFSDPDGTAFISENNLPLDGTYSQWTVVSGWFLAPPAAQTADIMFRCPAPTTVDINGDDFSVRELL
ncbi:hypothetical protein [Caldilinea sp.]|uniref:hypothetical protein n=1 Tax=Caldilinea sp. TaxID=2293560 RepID=UPI0025907B03|nr:hypothetical protein [Caldilinea sp.]